MIARVAPNQRDTQVEALDLSTDTSFRNRCDSPLLKCF
jgi:hypothetical protein